MDKIKEFIGIDVLISTFDVWSLNIGHLCLNNDKEGFKELCKHMDKPSWCVMEGTGTYVIIMFKDIRGYIYSIKYYW